MSEAHRYKAVKMLSEAGNRISYDPHGPDVVMADAYDQLKTENDALREENDKFARRNGMLEENVKVLADTHILYTWLRKKVDQPSNEFVAVHMNIGHDWAPVHDLDRDLRAMIEREEP